MTELNLTSIEAMKKIRWRCGHGGMLELDLIFTHYFDSQYSQLTQAQQHDFVALLELPDAQLFAWIMGYNTPTEQFSDTIERIRQFNMATHFKAF